MSNSISGALYTAVTGVAFAGGVYGFTRGLKYTTYITVREPRSTNNELVDGIMNTAVDAAHLFGYTALNAGAGAALAVTSPVILPWYFYHTKTHNNKLE